MSKCQDRKWGSQRLHEFIKFTEVLTDRPGIQTKYCFRENTKLFSATRTVVYVPPSENNTVILITGDFTPTERLAIYGDTFYGHNCGMILASSV